MRQERRTEEGRKRERGKLWRKARGDVLHTRRKGRLERKGRRTETIIALSYHCTVINSLLVRESVPRLGPGMMTNHLHPALQSWLFMIRHLIRTGRWTSWVSIRLGPMLSLSGPGDNLKWGHSFTSYSALASDRHFSTSSSGYWWWLTIMNNTSAVN